MRFSNKSLFLLVVFLIISFFLLNYNIKQSLADDSITKTKEKLLKILGNIIRFLFSILMLVGSALFIFLGIKYIGNLGKVEELHRSILYIVLGIILLLVSVFVPNLIKDFIENAIK